MIEVFSDVDSLIAAAADQVISAATQAVKERGRFVVALSGGHSPRPLYRLLAETSHREKMPWSNTYVLWSDERYVPIDDERSNAGNAETIMLKNVPVPVKQVFPMYMDGKQPDEAARLYEDTIRQLFADGEPRLDLVLLGCGEDGHTASLFPESPVLAERHSLIKAVKPQASDVVRITMTPVLLNQARLIVFLAYGESKAKAVKRVLSADASIDELPARSIKPADGYVRWLLDDEAAWLLEG